MKQSNNIQDFVNTLLKGKVCVFNTDTVAGIGCLAYVNGTENWDGVEKIFSIKDRKFDKKLPWLVSDFKMLEKYSDGNLLLAQKHAMVDWPGATTLVVHASNLVHQDFCIKKGDAWTLAMRSPSVQDLIEIIQKTHSPIVCTSANFSGEKSVSCLSNLSSDFLNKVDFVYSKPFSGISAGKASRIIDCTEECERVLRNN